MESHTLAHARPNSSHFVSKVLGLFALSIGVSGLGVYVGFNLLIEVFYTNPLFMFGAFIVELGLILTSRLWSKTEPLNYLLFTAFTFISGLTVVPLLLSLVQEFKSFELIYRALFTTTATFLAAGLIGWRSEKSLSGWVGFLTMGLVGLLIVSLMGLFFPWGNSFELIVSGFGVLLFAAFAAVDINRLREYPENEYIMAAIQLYLDIFNLFIYILRFTSALSKR